jgi:hypothetical protein
MKLLKLNTIMILGLLAFSAANAHCPKSFLHQSESYCLNFEWQKAELRPQGQFVESQELSPILNFMAVPSQQRLFSKANIAVWKEGDSEHKPVYLEDLQVYPFMVMANGHSHGARSNFYYDDQQQVYVLAEMSFQEMNGGCWQIRFKSEKNAEQILSNIEVFTNLTADENYNQSLMCSICSTEPQDHPVHHH